jgi:hypothetical protein
VFSFKKLFPADFGGNKCLETAEKHEKAKKPVLQDSDEASEDGQDVEEFLAEVEAGKHKEQENSEEITDEESNLLNCVLEEGFKELAGMHLFEETRVENEDFVELASVLNEESQESSESEEDVSDSSSEDEEVVSVLDCHEGILKDLFQEKDAQSNQESQGQKVKEDSSGTIKSLKSVKIKEAAVHKRSKKISSMAEGKSMERMGRFMSKLKIATFPLKNTQNKGRLGDSGVSNKGDNCKKEGNNSLPLITYVKRGKRHKERKTGENQLK